MSDQPTLFGATPNASTGQDVADAGLYDLVDEELAEFAPGQGEDESDVEDDATSFSATLAASDWTVETLVTQMRKGRIDLSPSFQRRNAWLNNRKSKLIESILLGFPVPQIVIAERRDKPAHYFVLDGKQRLLALRQFFADPNDERDSEFEPLQLEGMTVLKDLNGSNLATIDSRRADASAELENYTIRTIRLSGWNSERLLLSLFLRLNTGSVQLSPQELRQALIPGAFMQWLDVCSSEMPALRTLLGNEHPDRRMADTELLLRHIAFSTSSRRYRSNLKGFLDQVSRDYTEGWSDLATDAEAAASSLSQALDACQEIFPNRTACRRYYKGKYERSINRAVFDVQAYSMSLPEVRSVALDKRDEIEPAFRKLCVQDPEFIANISTTTKTFSAFEYRHAAWRSVVEEVTGVSYLLPSALERNSTQ